MVSLVTIGANPSADLISELEDLLVKARAGELTGMVAAVQQKDLALVYRCAGVKERFTCIGYLYYIINQLVAQP